MAEHTSDHGYDYAEGDRLAVPNTYFYTRYGGREFLRAWARQRAAALAELPDPVDPPAVAESLPEGADTASLLERLAGDVASPALDALVRRFEVTKRIHHHYDARFRPLPGVGYDDLSLYVRFAEVLDARIERHAHLPYLNALLKCIDTLCAMHRDLDDALGARLAGLIGRERARIVELAGAKGVSW